MATNTTKRFTRGDDLAREFASRMRESDFDARGVGALWLSVPQTKWLANLCRDRDGVAVTHGAWTTPDGRVWTWSMRVMPNHAGLLHVERGSTAAEATAQADEEAIRAAAAEALAAAGAAYSAAVTSGDPARAARAEAAMEAMRHAYTTPARDDAAAIRAAYAAATEAARRVVAACEANAEA